MTATLDEVQAALAPIATSLGADGYDLTTVLGDSGGVTIRIIAREGACEDCLVPKTIMQPMIDGVLRKSGVETTVEDIVYPKDKSH